MTTTITNPSTTNPSTTNPSYLSLSYEYVSSSLASARDGIYDAIGKIPNPLNDISEKVSSAKDSILAVDYVSSGLLTSTIALGGFAANSSIKAFKTENKDESLKELVKTVLGVVAALLCSSYSGYETQTHVIAGMAGAFAVSFYHAAQNHPEVTHTYQAIEPVFTFKDGLANPLNEAAIQMLPSDQVLTA